MIHLPKNKDKELPADMEKDEAIVINMMPLSFYRAGGVYTGSVEGMRYMVRKEEADENVILRAYVWPGPFRFDVTKDDLKKSEDFEISEEGSKKAAEWLRAAYYEEEEEFSKPLVLTECDDRLKDV